MTYEYDVVEMHVGEILFESKNVLNKVGEYVDDGWELTGVKRCTEKGGFFHYSFRRPVGIPVNAAAPAQVAEPVIPPGKLATDGASC